MSVKTVPVTLPDWVWGRLATIAEVQGVDVEDVIAGALSRVIDEDTSVRALRGVA